MHIGYFNGRIPYTRPTHLHTISPPAWRMTHATATPSATLEANVPAAMTLMNILPFI